MNLSYQAAIVVKAVGPVNGSHVDCSEHAECLDKDSPSQMHDQANSLQEFASDLQRGRAADTGKLSPLTGLGSPCRPSSLQNRWAAARTRTARRQRFA